MTDPIEDALIDPAKPPLFQITGSGYKIAMNIENHYDLNIAIDVLKMAYEKYHRENTTHEE